MGGDGGLLDRMVEWAVRNRLLVLLALLATVGSIGAAGIPGAGLIMMAAIFTAVGVPLETIAFVAGVHPLVGLYAAFIVGLITAVFGGRPGMISGATGAMAVVMVRVSPAMFPPRIMAIPTSDMTRPKAAITDARLRAPGSSLSKTASS